MLRRYGELSELRVLPGLRIPSRAGRARAGRRPRRSLSDDPNPQDCPGRPGQARPDRVIEPHRFVVGEDAGKRHELSRPRSFRAGSQGGLPPPLADSVRGDRAHARRRLERKVIQAERDKRTRLRFSRISIARCADLVRSPASAWGPLSPSVHRVTGARATDQRPCAQDLQPGGVGVRQNSYGGRWRTNRQAWWCRLLTLVTVVSGYPASSMYGAVSQRVGPAIRWSRCLTMSRTTSSGSGVAAAAALDLPADAAPVWRQRAQRAPHV